MIILFILKKPLVLLKYIKVNKNHFLTFKTKAFGLFFDTKNKEILNQNK